MINTIDLKRKSSNIHGVGRRKSSVARVWLQSTGKGTIEVNGKDYRDYFTSSEMHNAIEQPLKVCGTDRSVSIKVNVTGGGSFGQAHATKLAIARALLVMNETYRQALRNNGLLTVDSRVKERKKYGQKAARRKFQFVKR
ncbi:MAG: 30S ribosomal protein S9 [Candidatus Babeliales bacterium]|jgi:small subunit ribosomal protein S9